LDPDAAFAAMYLTVYWSDNPKERFEEVLRANPLLAEHETISEVRSILDEEGYVPLW
jgi:hypothetical protein